MLFALTLTCAAMNDCAWLTSMLSSSQANAALADPSSRSIWRMLRSMALLAAMMRVNCPNSPLKTTCPFAKFMDVGRLLIDWLLVVLLDWPPG